MSVGILVYLVSRLVVVAITAFLAILLWSRTRDLAWMLIVIGAVASYADLLFDLLVRFGLLDEAGFSPWASPSGAYSSPTCPSCFSPPPLW